MNILEILNSGRVERFHAVPGVTKQTIAAHSWGLVAILMYLDPERSRNLLLAATYHDCAEIWTGDVPFPVKKFGDPQLKKILDEEEDKWFEEKGVPTPQLTADEKYLLKVSDCLEGMNHCENCLMEGQEGAMESWGNWLDLVGGHLLPLLEKGGNPPTVLARVRSLLNHFGQRYRLYHRRMSL